MSIHFSEHFSLKGKLGKLILHIGTVKARQTDRQVRFKECKITNTMQSFTVAGRPKSNYYSFYMPQRASHDWISRYW